MRPLAVAFFLTREEMRCGPVRKDNPISGDAFLTDDFSFLQWRFTFARSPHDYTTEKDFTLNIAQGAPNTHCGSKSEFHPISHGLPLGYPTD